MSAEHNNKIVNNDTDDEITPDQEFVDMQNAAFQKKLDAYLKLPDKVAVTYRTHIKGPDKEIDFQRKRMVPAAAIERAKHDDGFNHKFCHSIGFQYREEMKALATQEGQMKCQSCRQPATMIVQAPFGIWHVDPPSIQDEAAIPLCGASECDVMAKQKFTSKMSVAGDFLQKVMDETDQKRCGSCGKLGKDLLRCSRCQEAYFCNRECQKRAWKEHQKECQPVAAASATG